MLIVWLIAIIICMIIEAIVKNKVFMGIACGFLAAGIVNGLHGSFVFQIVALVIVALFFATVGRKLLDILLAKKK